MVASIEQQTLADLIDQIEVNTAIIGLVKEMVEEPDKVSEIEKLLETNRQLVETAQTALTAQ